MGKTIGVHLLHFVPFSSRVHDRAGNPKVGVLGQVERMRDSSQSSKYALKQSFGENAGSVLTKDVRGMIVDEIQKQAPSMGLDVSPAEAKRLAREVMAAAHKKFDPEKKDDEEQGNGKNASSKSSKASEKAYFTDDDVCLKALVNFGTAQAERMAHVALLVKRDGLDWAAGVLDDDSYDGALSGMSPQRAANAILLLKKDACPVGLWQALFGVFFADVPETKMMGSFSVADSFGIEENEIQVDTLAGNDARAPKTWTGAAMLDDPIFQSGVMYRYACLDVDDLIANLNGDVDAAANGARVLIRNWLPCLPKAKSTSHAHFTFPDAVVLHVHDGFPQSLANAFLRPVRVYGDKSVMQLGTERMVEKIQNDLKGTWCMDEEHGSRYLVLNPTEEAKALAAVASDGDLCANIDQLCDKVAEIVRNEGAGGSDAR